MKIIRQEDIKQSLSGEYALLILDTERGYEAEKVHRDTLDCLNAINTGVYTHVRRGRLEVVRVYEGVSSESINMVRPILTPKKQHKYELSMLDSLFYRGSDNATELKLLAS